MTHFLVSDSDIMDSVHYLGAVISFLVEAKSVDNNEHDHIKNTFCSSQRRTSGWTSASADRSQRSCDQDIRSLWPQNSFAMVSID